MVRVRSIPSIVIACHSSLVWFLEAGQSLRLPREGLGGRNPGFKVWGLGLGFREYRLGLCMLHPGPSTRHPPWGGLGFRGP